MKHLVATGLKKCVRVTHYTH